MVHYQEKLYKIRVLAERKSEITSGSLLLSTNNDAQRHLQMGIAEYLSRDTNEDEQNSREDRFHTSLLSFRVSKEPSKSHKRFKFFSNGEHLVHTDFKYTFHISFLLPLPPKEDGKVTPRGGYHEGSVLLHSPAPIRTPLTSTPRASRTPRTSQARRSLKSPTNSSLVFDRFNRFTMIQLKEVCRESKPSLSGFKANLIQRLINKISPDCLTSKPTEKSVQKLILKMERSEV